MFTEEHLYAVALRKCQRIGDILYLKLVDYFGSAKTAWENGKKEFGEVSGVGLKTVEDIGSPEILKFAENELELCVKNNIRILLVNGSGYPALLKECDDAPAVLYQKGSLNELSTTISIVGTRNMTSYGKSFISEFLQQLSVQQVTTVSGLALGVDAEVHSKSLDYGIPTVAVLGHGLNTVYPSKNRVLLEKILDNGGTVFSEFNFNQKPEREYFIQRNRIIAGLSASTVVVESAYGGGSMSTATFANIYNRNVYALPGRITDKHSQGCNLLIFQNKASAFPNVNQLVEDLGLDGKKPESKTGELFPEVLPELPEEQAFIYKIIEKTPNISLDELSVQTDLPTFKLLPVLLELEINGFLKSFSGRQFAIRK